MGLKPDHWIRKMALEHGMIEPFVEKQMREGVISFGLSSYGYDMRIADEFKIFTNVYSAVVDPKNFSPQSFVDFKGDVCIIPPNSFALARSIEYFKIPRSVLTVCLGKCVTGDTRIVDAQTGAYLPIKQALQAVKTLSLNSCWQLQESTISNYIPNGMKPVYELTTKTGLKIKATAEHPFRKLSEWIPLRELKPGDRIAVARQIPIFGKTAIPDWEAILLGLMIAEGQCHTPNHSPTFTSADNILVQQLERCVKAGFNGVISYKGRYGYRLVNRIGRGGIPEYNRAYQWLKDYGLNVKAAEKFVPQAIFTAPRESVTLFLRALFSGDGSVYTDNKSIFLEYYSNSRQLIEDIHHLLLRYGIISVIRSKKTQVGTIAHKIQVTDREHVNRFTSEIGFWANSKKQLRLENEIMPLLADRAKKQRSNFDTLPSEAWLLINETAHEAGMSLRSMGIRGTSPSQSLPFSIARRVSRATNNQLFLNLVDGGPLWDVVEDITYVGEEEVFDLSIPQFHNFVANDIVIHNSTYARCGQIVNVTPFEPQWEGHVTLEISNTTPLPAKIYANEGIAQVLFFEADEECEVSYADKKGKYQGQTGVTPPRL